MAYRYGNRNQIRLFPESMEDYIAPDDPVRAYDAFIGALDFRNLGITLDSNKVGNSEYHPHAMLKLLVYGYSYGIRSSRKLERATHHNLSFVWLTSGLKPDHKTIAEFRRKNKEALAQVLKQCAKICIKLNLIEGNTLFVDGTKIRANASINRLDNINNHAIQVIVPSQRQALRKKPSSFAKEHFTYFDNYYLCPEGHKLIPYRLDKSNNRVYKINHKKICLSCSHYGICTKSPTGRTISRLLKEEVRQKLEAQYDERSSREIYKLRKEKVELPFGHIKHNLKFDSFLLRGLKGVKAEASIIGTCFNLVRMITLLGVPGLVKELNAC